MFLKPVLIKKNNNHINTDRVRSCRIRNDRVRNDWVRNDRVRNDRVRNDRVRNDRVRNYRVRNYRVRNDSGLEMIGSQKIHNSCTAAAPTESADCKYFQNVFCFISKKRIYLFLLSHYFTITYIRILTIKVQIKTLTKTSILLLS